jgi:hypothetical protein
VLDVGEDYLDATEAEEGIAAADTLARLKGRFYVRNSYTKSLDAWVERHPITPSAELVEAAVQAIDRILSEPSELLELWSEGDSSEWLKQMVALKERLR